MFFSCPVFLDDIINILSGTFTLNTYKSRAYLCMCVSNTKNINCLYVCTNQTFFRLVLQRPTEKYMYSNQTKIQFIFSFVSIPKKPTIYSCLRHETCKKRKKNYYYGLNSQLMVCACVSFYFLSFLPFVSFVFVYAFFVVPSVYLFRFVYIHCV